MASPFGTLCTKGVVEESRETIPLKGLPPRKEGVGVLAALLAIVRGGVGLAGAEKDGRGLLLTGVVVGTDTLMVEPSFDFLRTRIASRAAINMFSSDTMRSLAPDNSSLRRLTFKFADCPLSRTSCLNHRIFNDIILYYSNM